MTSIETLTPDRDTDGERAGRRARIVLGGYACGPGDQPEAGAGWAFAKAAARDHDVWVFTRERFRDAVTADLANHPDLAPHLHMQYLDLPPWLMRHAKRKIDIYWYYILWQRLMGRRAKELHAELGFDVAHHVTFANDWLPCGLTVLDDVPLVWGPVGGASQVPLLKVAKWLGARGLMIELLRKLMTGVPRVVWGDAAARRSAIVLAQNPSVAHRFRYARRVVVEPNSAIEVDQLARREESRPAGKTALFVGRLIGFKVPRLAIATIARPAAQGWRLEVFGTGYELKHLQRLAQRLGVTDRVEFKGHRPRTEILAAYAYADALLFPSIHDQGPWSVSEASSAGCPVVCLPLGGPATLAERNARVASLRGDLADNLARALGHSGDRPGERHDRFRPERLPDLVSSWYAEAAAIGPIRLGRLAQIRRSRGADASSCVESSPAGVDHR